MERTQEDVFMKITTVAFLFVKQFKVKRDWKIKEEAQNITNVPG